MDDNDEITLDIEESIVVGQTKIILLDIRGSICKLGIEGIDNVLRGELLKRINEKTTSS